MRLRALGLSLAIVLGPATIAAQAPLGEAEFPNSGAAAAQAPFLRGLLLLHSFEYEAAAAAFRDAQKLDPQFVLAFWGEAMTHTHPLWNQQDVPAARAVLARLGATAAARAARARTPREAAWLGAVEVLYGDGGKAQRDTLYHAAMVRLAADHPDDEARLFEALARMGLSQSVRDVPNYMQAGAVALEVLERRPRHPGAAHYVIHAFDDPVHAPLGLRAANAYAGIAPGAAHAQHMTTHIYLALGMWPGVVAQNITATEATQAGYVPGHYTEWLHYGLLQQGRTADAAALLARVRPGGGPQARAVRRAALLGMRAAHVVNGEAWQDDALDWDVDTTGTGRIAQAQHAMVGGWVALRGGDRAVVADRQALLDRLVAEADGLDATHPDRADLGFLRVMAMELRALTLEADGRADAALALLRDAVRLETGLPAAFGPPPIVKPSAELLGERLLARADRPGARDAFRTALALAPGRLLSERGLAAATGDGGGRSNSTR